MNLVQRVLLIAIVLVFVIFAAFLINWARRPDMAILYSNLDPEEAAKITEKLSEQGIVYKLASGGTTVYAPKEHIAQIRLDMAREGLPEGGQKGYRIFDNEKIGISPFVQNINLKRAIQDELAKSIQMIEGVGFARVHIVNTEQKLFSSQASEISASVVLQLKPGYRLGSSNVAAITHLVAGSVEGLKSENVTVVDSQGRLLCSKTDDILTNGAGTIADYRERVEQNLAGKVEEMLTAVLGPNRATVKVSAIIDMNNVNTLTEKYDPKGVASKEEITSGSEVEPVSAPAEGETVTAGQKKDETIVTEYMIGKTVTQRAELPGRIKSVKVAAVVDLSPADANEATEGEQVAKIMELSDVENLIRNALGLKSTDSLTVVEAKFHRPTESLIDEEAGGLDFVTIARHSSMGVMAICAFLVFKIFGGAKKKAGKGGPEQLPEGGEAAGLLPAGEGASEQLVLRKQIASSLQSNPEQARQLFSSWLEDKGS